MFNPEIKKQEYIKEGDGEKNKQYFFNEEMKEMESGMFSLVEKLKNKIENGDYDVIISEEAGGRIPALILERLIKEKGNANIKTIFLSDRPDNSKIADFIKNKKLLINKALIITEFIKSGESLIEFIKKLEDGGLLQYDVAVVRAADAAAKNLNDFFAERSQKFYCGEIKEKIPYYDRNSGRMAGVTRADSNDFYSPHPIINVEVPQDYVNKARQDVKIIIEKIIQNLDVKTEKIGE